MTGRPAGRWGRLSRGCRGCVDAGMSGSWPACLRGCT